MQVSFEEGALFYKLFAALLGYVNRKLAVVAEQFSGPGEYTSLPGETRGKVRNALYEHRELIDRFVAENPAGLPPEELEIVSSWKHALVGKFYIFRYLKKHTIFINISDQPYKAYGVLGLADPIEDLVGRRSLPILCNAVLLPFNGRIIYDGLIAPYSVTFGGGVRRHLNEDYHEAKEAFGIITSLGGQSAQLHEKPKMPKKRPEKAMAMTGSRLASGEAKSIAGELIEMTDAFCKEFLNEEYAELCRKLAETLARKRPSPLLQGKPEAWASGIVRTIGWVNFLHDPSQEPHMKLSSIDNAFGVGESTGAARLKTIRTTLRIHQLDPKWTLPSKMDENPRIWLLEVNGFVMDIRHAPREAQMVAYEKGLIPYIPADRGRATEEP
jgi:hypothetical protein